MSGLAKSDKGVRAGTAKVKGPQTYNGDFREHRDYSDTEKDVPRSEAQIQEHIQTMSLASNNLREVLKRLIDLNTRVAGAVPELKEDGADVEPPYPKFWIGQINYHGRESAVLIDQIQNQLTRLEQYI